MSGPVDVLSVMDTVARGCALHADKCVGEVGERWAKVAIVDYDEARAAVAELIEASRAFTNDDRLRYRPMMVRLHAALARVGGAE